MCGKVTAERDTPPVPPADFDTYDDPALERRILDREEQNVGCPLCDHHTLHLEERQTGRRVLGYWSGDVFDSETYRLSEDWPEIETVETCRVCGWERGVA